MSEGPAEQHADRTMPDVELHYQCTRGTGSCPEDARYIARGHSCETKHTGEGALYAVCQTHIDQWQTMAYPVRCAKCKHSFGGPLDLLWEVCAL